MIMMRVEYTDYLADCGSNHNINNSNDGIDGNDLTNDDDNWDDNKYNDGGEKKILTINRRGR